MPLIVCQCESVDCAGLVTGIAGTLFLMSLFLKNLRQQGTLESSGAALVIAFLLGQFVPALDNGYATAISILPAEKCLAWRTEQSCLRLQMFLQH
jgi:hypothetical protein